MILRFYRYEKRAWQNVNQIQSVKVKIGNEIFVVKRHRLLYLFFLHIFFNFRQSKRENEKTQYVRQKLHFCTFHAKGRWKIYNVARCGALCKICVCLCEWAKYDLVSHRMSRHSVTQFFVAFKTKLLACNKFSESDAILKMYTYKLYDFFYSFYFVINLL